MRLRGAVKPPTFALPFVARTRHALLLAANSCTRKVFFKRGELTNARSALVGVAETGVNALFDDFWYFWSYKSTRKEKYLYVSRGRTMFAPTMRVVDGADPYKIKLKYSQQTKEK